MKRFSFLIVLALFAILGTGCSADQMAQAAGWNRVLDASYVAQPNTAGRIPTINEPAQVEVMYENNLPYTARVEVFPLAQDEDGIVLVTTRPTQVFEVKHGVSKLLIRIPAGIERIRIQTRTYRGSISARDDSVSRDLIR